MPVDTSFGDSAHEPQPVFTGCLCPNVRQGMGTHELSCPTQPLVVKRPALYAGKRAWRRYKDNLTTRKGM